MIILYVYTKTSDSTYGTISSKVLNFFQVPSCRVNLLSFRKANRLNESLSESHGWWCVEGDDIASVYEMYLIYLMYLSNLSALYRTYTTTNISNNRHVHSFSTSKHPHL